MATELKTPSKQAPAKGGAPKKSKTPPWLKHAGWAADDAIYDEAMRLGAEWRKRQNRLPKTHAGGR